MRRLLGRTLSSPVCQPRSPQGRERSPIWPRAAKRSISSAADAGITPKRNSLISRKRQVSMRGLRMFHGACAAPAANRAAQTSRSRNRRATPRSARVAASRYPIRRAAGKRSENLSPVHQRPLKGARRDAKPAGNAFYLPARPQFLFRPSYSLLAELAGPSEFPSAPFARGHGFARAA